MSHPLKQKIAGVRGRVRRLVALYGICRVAAVVLASVLVAGLADYLIRFQDPGIRLIASATVATIVAWACFRHLVLPLSIRVRDVDLARRVQQYYPALGDELASAVEFLDQSEDDPWAGSVALRRAVITRATAKADQLDFKETVEPRSTWRASLAAAGLGLVTLVLVVLDPSSSGKALQRLALPMGETAWPQTTHLVPRHRLGASGEVDFESADRVARGHAFEVEVIDRFGVRLPADVRIHYELEDADGGVTHETEPMHVAADAMVARRENVTRPFSYRATGGDDDSMPPIRVEVLEPPAVASLVVHLAPPNYSGWPNEETDGDVRALVGTQVRLSATVTKPLVSAVLCLEGGRRLPTSLASDGRSLVFPAEGSEPLLVDKSIEGEYWLELTDTKGLTAGHSDPWQISVVVDAPPSVTIERPSATVFVTPEATVPIRLSAKDDLAIERISLRFERSDRTEEDPVEIALPFEADLPDDRSSQTEPGTSHTVDYTWHLAALELPPATQVTFRGTATDRLPQTGTSEPGRLVVITPAELAERIASRQAFILSELARVLDMQSQSRRQVGALEIRLDEVGSLDQLDVDHLRSAELTQRQVTRTLTSPSEGVPMHIEGLLADLANNKVDSPDVRRRMGELLAEIRRIEQDHLPPIARGLTASIKAATVALQESKEDPSVAEPLAMAGAEQDEVIAALEQILGRLARWDNFRRFHRDVGQLLGDQEELAQRSADLARHTLTKDPSDLTPEESADLKITARDQSELARRLDRIQQAVKSAVGTLAETDPLAAETLSDALDRATELGIGASMRDAAANLERNRMGQATTNQRRAIEDLREVLDILANRREHELARLVRKLRQAEADLADLTDRQEDLHDRLEEAAAEPDADTRARQMERLRQEQEALREEAERLRRRLQRLMAEEASRSLGEAAEKMQEAGKRAAEGECGEASARAGEAQEKLEEAQERLAEQRRQAELELATEQLAQLEDNLKGLRRRQEKAGEETVRLDGLLEAHDHLTDAQEASLDQLAREQRMLRDETTVMADQLTGAMVFLSALSDATEQMDRATAMLDRRQTGQATQASQKAALRRLDQLLESLKPDEPGEPEEDASSAGAGQGGPPQGGSPGALKALTELKLLKILQQELNLRTQDLNERFGDPDTMPDEARRQHAELSRQQGRLADLLLNLVPPAPDPESSPGGLGPLPQPPDKEESR